MVRTLRTAAALASLLGVSIAADAAGLGKLTINSALGQVLNAEIEIVSAQPTEIDTISARVAAPEAFREARIEYGASLRLLRFAVDKRANGTPILKITSIAPINEPFLDVLVDMSWPAGRMQREYPILLDPPGYAQGKMTPPAVAAVAPRPAEQQPAPEPAASPSAPASSEPSSATTGTGTPSASAEMPSTAKVTPAESGGGSVAGSDTYGPVQKGETLNKIASEVKPSTVSLEQMLVALYRENKSAFINNNMNLMKTGQILKVPTADEVAAIEQKDARQEIRTQVADWKGYRDQVAGSVASIPARPESGSSASGKIASAAVTPPPPPATESKDVLKLSRTDTGTKGGASKGGAGSQDRISALQEELTAKNKALQEANSRVADLEKQIQDMKRLMDLKAGAPTKAEAPKVAAAPMPAPTKAEPPKPEPPKVAEVKPEPPKVAEAPKTEPPKVAEAPKTEPPKAAEAPKTTPPAPPKAAPKKAAPPPEPSLMDQLADNWAIIAGGLVGLGAIVGGFIFYRRRKAGAEAGPSSSMTSAFPSDLKPESGTGKPGGGLVDTGNSSFLTDFDKTGPGTVDTDEVDPVAEAEVYIAYGRDAQAEEILKEAMARDKSRPEIALKLLEIYHARKSATAFETVAKELHASVGDSSPLWQKAAAMGAQIDPNNALYAGAAASGATYTPEAPAAKPDVDFAADAAAPAPDFDIGGGDKAAEAAPSIDFDLPSSGGGAPAHAASSAAPAEEKAPSFDFDLSGLEMPGKSAPAAPASTPAAGGGGLELADLSLDAPAGGGGGEGAGTKLELAKAYLEIGDKDGARDILNEVAKEGSAEQKEEAKKLIASL